MNLKRLLRSLATALAGTLVVFAIVIGAGLMLSGSSPDLSYRTLDYDVAVQADGSLKVTQHIDMKLRARDGDTPWRQLYQKYTLREDGLTNITDISVRNVTAGENYEQGVLASPADHSDTSWDREYAGHWYIADVTDGAENPQPFDPAKDGYEISDNTTSRRSKDVEIGWNIPATKKASSLKFDVTMTLHGGTTLYKDVASWQWEPFGDSNLIPIGKVTGIVRFPDGIDASSSWAWLHYAGVSENSRMDDGSLRFSASDVRAGQYLDVVAAYDASAVKPPYGWRQGDAAWVRRQAGRTYLPKLKQSEDQQEIAWRQQQAGPARVRVALWIAVVLAGLALFIIGMVAAVRSYRESQYHGDIEYWREPPDMSPASGREDGGCHGTVQGQCRLAADDGDDAVARLEEGDRHLSGSVEPVPGRRHEQCRQRASGRHDWRRRGQGEVAGQDDDHSAAADGIRQGRGRELNLSQSERAALSLMQKVSKRVGSPVFDLDGMKRHCEDWKNGYKALNLFTEACSSEFAMLGATRDGGTLASWMGGLGAALALVSGIIAVFGGNIALALIISAPIMMLSIVVCSYAASSVLTSSGQRYAGQVQGLYRYLQDFSNFSDRGVADMVLWDRYLVYAAAFGISDRVMAEFAKAYPQVTDPQWLDAHGAGSLLYWSYRPYGYGYMGGPTAGAGAGGVGGGFDPASFSANFGDFGARLNAGFSEIGSVIHAAASGGGGFGGISGGSFSGGGGFGGSSGGIGGGSFGGR